MTEFEKKLQKYAEIVVKVGLNIQPGQRLLIGPVRPFMGGVPLQLAPLVRAITREAYLVGARYVEVIWNDPQTHLIRAQYAAQESLEDFPTWHTELSLSYANNGDAFLTIYALDPALFDDVDSTRMDIIRATGSKNAAPSMRMVGETRMNWCLISAPVTGWSDVILPDVPEAERIDTLWELIFKITRADRPDPLADWAELQRSLHTRCDYLNTKQYKALKYRGPGTDLQIDLVANHLWRGGSGVAQNGIEFTPNIPTEEIYSMPHKNGVNGVVVSTKPLIYNGSTIDEFRLVFQDGAVVEANAKRGENALKTMLASDEGARRLGEVALVPHSSPISQTGRVFYNTLIDENASCHVALGSAYPFTIKDGHAMSPEQLAEAGVNRSIIHVDFMIGSGELDIDGITADGSTEPVLRQGEWAFRV